MRVLIRADASATVGTGHVMRCLAMGEALAAAGHEPTLASSGLPEALRRRADEHDIALHALDSPPGPEELAVLAAEVGSDWAILDGYDLGVDHAAALRDGGLRVLVVDDEAALSAYPADLVLNQNAHAARSAYRGRAPGARLLLGPRYALLRGEFVRYEGWSRQTAERAEHLLVTFGGSDPAQGSERVVEALRDGGPPLKITLLVGGANPRADELAAIVRDDVALNVLRDPDGVPELMAAADLAISAAGTTSWELAYMQLPTLAVVAAANQAGIAPALERAGVAVDLGPVEALDGSRLSGLVADLADDAPRRSRMAAAGRELVDGHGARRVMRAMETAGLRVRRATMADARLLFDWANDPDTRAASFSSEPIPWETHLGWVERSLADPDALVLIGEDAEPIGQVRFRRESLEVAVISISVGPAARGRGYAPPLIDAGTRAALAAWPVDRVRAEIRAENQASRASFADAGYGRPEPLERAAPGAVAMWIERLDDDLEGR